MKKHLLLILSVFVILSACNKLSETEYISKSPTLPEEPYDYKTLELPKNTSIPSDLVFLENSMFTDPNFENNVHGEHVEIDDNAATLGRVLFYDKNLSLNNTISCGSCHLQSKAFADGTQFSSGFEGKLTDRNSMAIINPLLQRNLFWDSRSFSINDLSLRPVQHHVEMGMQDLSALVEKLESVPYYKELFQKSYNSSEITSDKIASALTSFIASFTTSNSKFDQGLEDKNDNFKNFTEIEQLGREVFNSEKAQCSSCHASNNFSPADGPSDPYGGGGSSGGKDLKGTTNIGLDFVSKDKGRENGSFRIPSLRNIALTGPYMHDGRFNTLEEVIDHYRSGIKPAENLDPKFMDAHGNVKMLDINDVEKFALIAFLKTLTDESFINNPKYSDPFQD